MKRYITMLVVLLGITSLKAQLTDLTFVLYNTKIELNGEVKLVWTKPASVSSDVQFTLYRRVVSDSASLKLITTTRGTEYTDTVHRVSSGDTTFYEYFVLATSGEVTYKSNMLIVVLPAIPPIGSFRLEGKIDDGKVKLAWQAPPVNTPVSYYLVYQVIIGGMLRIDSTTNRWSVTNLPQLQAALLPVKFVYFVKAILLSGDTLGSTILQLTIGGESGDNELRFVSLPPLFGIVGDAYNYTAKAVLEHPDSTAIIAYFGGIRNSSGFLEAVVDSFTGKIEWTPAKKGFYKVDVYAEANTGGHAEQKVTVTITNGNGIVQGKVTDTLNVGIPGVIINAYSTVDDHAFSLDYQARTDANGNYRISFVEPGSYKLFAQSPSAKYQSQWYDGKREASQADIVIVADSPSVTFANFKLRSGPANRPKITVTGKVTDTLGFAINGANCRVVFVRAEFALNFGGGIDVLADNFRKYFGMNAHSDFRLEGNSEFVFKAWTDSAGEYQVQLPAGRYIAFARAKGYAVEFYREASDILSADVIIVPDPRMSIVPLSIDFTLAPLPPVVLGGISGFVKEYNAQGDPIASRVIAFRDKGKIMEKLRVARAYITDTDSTGAYSFDELVPGKYIVLAVPLGPYSPSFYIGLDSADHRWKRAAEIEINGNTVDNINIYVKPFDAHADGYTFIQGKVTLSGSALQGMVKAGTFVYAARNDWISSYAITDAEGNFTITGLAPGEYTVFADRLGFDQSSSASVNVGYASNGAPLSGSADLSISGTTNVKVDNNIQPTRYTLAQNYPNPFNPSTTIGYSLPNAGNVTLKVYDLLGKEVATLVNGYQVAGNHKVTFNASHLTSGVYFYRLTTGSSYNVVKKMVLLK